MFATCASFAICCTSPLLLSYNILENYYHLYNHQRLRKYSYYSLIFPVVPAQHCNYATFLDGGSIFSDCLKLNNFDVVTNHSMLFVMVVGLLMTLVPFIGSIKGMDTT